MIGLVCEDEGGNYKGLLASLDNGVVSDASWKCSSSAPSGWSSPGFDDTTWQNANVIGQNGIAPWNMRSDFASSAQWIWGASSSENPIYCRHTVGTLSLHCKI